MIDGTECLRKRAAFDQLWDLDVDFIKVLSGLSRDAYFALAEQARHWQVPLEGQHPYHTSVLRQQDAIGRRASGAHDVWFICSAS